MLHQIIHLVFRDSHTCNMFTYTLNAADLANLLEALFVHPDDCTRQRLNLARLQKGCCPTPMYTQRLIRWAGTSYGVLQRLAQSMLHLHACDVPIQEGMHVYDLLKPLEPYAESLQARWQVREFIEAVRKLHATLEPGPLRNALALKNGSVPTKKALSILDVIHGHLNCLVDARRINFEKLAYTTYRAIVWNGFVRKCIADPTWLLSGHLNYAHTVSYGRPFHIRETHTHEYLLTCVVFCTRPPIHWDVYNQDLRAQFLHWTLSLNYILRGMRDFPFKTLIEYANGYLRHAKYYQIGCKPTHVFPKLANALNTNTYDAHNMNLRFARTKIEHVFEVEYMFHDGIVGTVGLIDPFGTFYQIMPLDTLNDALALLYAANSNANKRQKLG